MIFRRSSIAAAFREKKNKKIHQKKQPVEIQLFFFTLVGLLFSL
jgi:hypothetical protein